MILRPPSNNDKVGTAYTSGDATKLISRTVVPPELIKDIATEILSVISSAGITPSETDTAQLTKAISTLVQNDAYVKYMYSNVIDFCGAVNESPNIKDFTQFKSILLKFLRTSAALANTKQAGTVIIGDTLKTNNGTLDVKSTITKLGTITEATSLWAISGININKPVYIKKECSDKDGSLFITEVFGMVSPCTISREVIDHKLLIPTATKIELKIDKLTDCIVTAYQF